ncbi:SIS domain-containing protein [Candidatus Clostridium radicumherbarum]|uniref:SIS domain-containing protein n=1 Tax=Candidatus Clostridium radicumherbarum TaxID=3381662 RepID=A0ABW8TS17_9CLOT
MITNKYLEFVMSKLKEVQETQSENIEKAADLIVESCKKGGRFYVFGSGHSHMVAEELYIRAGGLAYVQGILPPELMLHEMPNKSTYLERLDGYAKSILDLYKVNKNDTIMIVSNSGRNNVPVEMCLYSKEIGASVIALTSLKHSTQVESRHKSGKNIYEIADVVIDNCAEKGDAAFYVEGFNIPTGPTSDATGIAIAQVIVVTVIDKLVKEGIDVPVFKSSNLDGADEYNNELFNKYY